MYLNCTLNYTFYTVPKPVWPSPHPAAPYPSPTPGIENISYSMYMTCTKPVSYGIDLIKWIMQNKKQQFFIFAASKQMLYGVYGNVISILEEYERREGRGSTRLQRSNIRIPDQSYKDDEHVRRGNSQVSFKNYERYDYFDLLYMNAFELLYKY